MVKINPEFQTAVGITAIAASSALMADPITLPEGINELYSPAARTAVRLTETSNNQFEAQIIDVRMHRMATLEFELREDGSVNVIASESDFYNNGDYEKGITGDKRGIIPDKIERKLRLDDNSIDQEHIQTLEDMMFANPDVWSFAGGEVAVSDIARIAETDAGNKMGTCIYIPNVEGDAQAALCLEHEFNINTSVAMTATMHVATPDGLVTSTILEDKMGWTDTPSGTPSTPVVHENIQRGLDAGMTYGSPSGM